jgi:hypothetical protein
VDYLLNFLPIAGLVSLVMRMVFLGGPEAYDRLFAVAVGEPNKTFYNARAAVIVLMAPY